MKTIEDNLFIGSSLDDLGKDLNSLCSDDIFKKIAIEQPIPYRQQCLGDILVEGEKPDKTKVPVDVKGNVIRVGDTVAWAVTEDRSASLRVAVVKAIGKSKYDVPTVKVEIPTRKYVYEDKKNYTGGHYVDTIVNRSVDPAGRMIIVSR